MIRIETDSLEEAYTEASLKLNCSFTELSYEIVQHPKKGFLGFGRKKAIIVATLNQVIIKEKVVVEDKIVNDKSHNQSQKDRKDTNVNKKIKTEVKKEIKESVVKSNHIEKQAIKEEIKKQVIIENKTVVNKIIVKNKPKSEIKTIKKDFSKSKDQKQKAKKLTTNLTNVKKITIEQDNDIINNFYKDVDIKKTESEIVEEIEILVNNLFSKICFDIDYIKVSLYDKETVLIEFQGKDSALLIGKDGYRYKALSYLLFNWINQKYNLMIRLEVAKFLQNQEDMMDKYLVSIIKRINEDGYGHTKVLDGVLVYIALKCLRDNFPNKYVAVRTNDYGEKYVIVNNFK